jgi:hypothetical protein
MAQIVLVHGIGKQVQGPRMLLTNLYPLLSDGLTDATASAAGLLLASMNG